MHLSMSMIDSYLSDYSRERSIKNDSLTIQGVRLLAGVHSGYSLDYAYIASAKDYFNDPKYSDSLIITNGPNYILCKDADHDTLINKILSAFDYYSSAHIKLIEAASSNKPIEDMIPAIEALLPYTLMIFSMDGTLLQVSHPEKIPQEEVVTNMHTKGVIDAATLGLVFTDINGHEIHDLSDHPQHLFIKDHPAGYVDMYIMQNDYNNKDSTSTTSYSYFTYFLPVW